jgi:PAS domain S-box-containing protein
MNANRTFYRVNHRILEILGYTYKDLEENIGKSAQAFHPTPESFKKFTQELIPSIKKGNVEKLEIQLKRKNGELIWCKIYGKALNPENPEEGILWIIDDIDGRKKLELERKKLVSELKEALQNVKTLKGLLPICSGCKKIRNDQGQWEQLELYIRNRSETEFSHGLCHDCAKQLYGNEDWFDQDEFED